MRIPGRGRRRPPRVLCRRAGTRLALSCAAAFVLLAGCGGASGPSTAGTHTTTSPPPDAAGVAVAVAQTAAGAVGYRDVGAGPPLLLLTGFGASIDSWPPSFLDALARDHRVVAMDNAGVGGTAAAAPLTITAMADQASALVTTLHLGRTSVLGWSMGGMVAQALAVDHPDEVSRLVLAATQAGTGNALPVPAAAGAAAASADPATVLSVLFPPDQAAAEKAYADQIVQYPGFYQAPAALKPAQTTAIEQWLAGAVPAGRAEGALRVPTLVADGTEDALDPVANDRLLARAIPQAQLVLYPDAGHAFLFQDATAFLSRVEAFLPS